jgi:hypothetical protein
VGSEKIRCEEENNNSSSIDHAASDLLFSYTVDRQQLGRIHD